MLDAFRRRTALLFVLSIATGCESLVPADADSTSTFGRGSSSIHADSEGSALGWTTIPAEGTCSMVSYNNRYWREMAADQNLVQVERELYSKLYGSRLEFSARQSWRHSKGTISGEGSLAADVLPSGDVFVLLKNKSTSSKFQMYAEPRQVTVFASSDKRIIRGSYGYNAKTISGYSALTRLSHVSDGSVRGKQDIQKVVASAECDVAYVLMKFQLCGRLHTFSMIQPEYFCGGGLPESELYESRGFSFDDAVDAEAYLQTLDLDVGEVAMMLGQGPVLPNGQRWRDGGVWRIMRMR